MAQAGRDLTVHENLRPGALKELPADQSITFFWMKPPQGNQTKRGQSEATRKWRAKVKLYFMAAVIFVAAPAFAQADEMCISTTLNFLSPNDQVCVTGFDDPKVPGVTCHIAQARAGGWSRQLGLNEDPANFSVTCSQTGPIGVDISKLPDNEEVFTEKTSTLFKHTHIYRMLDKNHNALVYLAISSRIISGSPANSITSVPIMPWGSQ